MNTQPNFGGDSTPILSFTQIAEQLRRLEVSALTRDQCDDVLAMIEWLRADTLRQVDELEKREAKLQEQELKLQEQQRQTDTLVRAAKSIVTPRVTAEERKNIFRRVWR